MYVQTQKYKQQICASETKDSFSSFIKETKKPQNLLRNHIIPVR